MNINFHRKRAARAINNRLGSLCSYHHENGDITQDTKIVINRNKPVKDEFGIIAGYRIEASILREDIDEVIIGESFTDTDEGDDWQIGQVLKKTSSKWTVDIFELKKNAHL